MQKIKIRRKRRSCCYKNQDFKKLKEMNGFGCNFEVVFFFGCDQKEKKYKEKYKGIKENF